MGQHARRSTYVLLFVAGVAALGLKAYAQVFTVGEKSATDSIRTEFKATNVELPTQPMTERGRRELIRDLADEQGLRASRPAAGTTLILQANGNMTPGGNQYKEAVYKKGQSAAPGDRVIITSLDIKTDRIIVDLNGGPYVKNRIMRHIQVGVGGAMSPNPNLMDQATGCRVTLMFEGRTPEVSAPEVKALLEPIIDFGAKTSEIAYAETLPTPVKSSIDSHEALVGMNHRMVLAALGEPEHKLREGTGNSKYEEWIYGHSPQTVKFVRFEGDRVSVIKIAALGKPIEIHDQDELNGYLPPKPTREIALGDGTDTTKEKVGAPSLKLPNEKQTPLDNPVQEAQVNRKVQYPDEKPKPIPSGDDMGKEAPAPPSLAGPTATAPGPAPMPGTVPPPSPSAEIPHL